MLILRGTDLERVLDVESLIAALTLAFCEVSGGEANMPIRLVMRLSNGSRISAMPAYLPRTNALATKLITAFPSNLAEGLPLIQGLVVLNNPSTGAPLAVMDGATLTGLRTAAGSALATRLLARPGAGVLCVLGAGLQARTHLRALAHVCRIRELRICARRLESAEQLAAEAAAYIDAPIRVVSHPQAAVRGADLIATLTTATEPILAGEWIAPGAHICAVGSHAPTARELDTLSVRKSSLIAVDTRVGCRAEAGDLLIPASEGVFDLDTIVELGEILMGIVPGRIAAEDITMYKSVGMAAMDVAAAALAYTIARARGIGIDVDI